MFSVRVPGGIRSGRVKRDTVRGKELPAPSTMPLVRFSLPSNAGRAMAALIPLICQEYDFSVGSIAGLGGLLPFADDLEIGDFFEA